MNHPLASVLQDYFENELNTCQARAVKDHLLNCDKCTLILSELAKVDVLFKSEAVEKISAVTQNRIFADAKHLLAQKKTANQQVLMQEKLREQQLRRLQETWQSLFVEIRVPLLQFASVSAMIAFMILSNRVEKEVVYEPFYGNDEALTHAEYNSPLPSGEKE